MGASAAPGEQPNWSLDACAEFYDQAFDGVFRYLCRAVLGNRVLAEDLTQETFTAVVASVRAGHAELQSMPWVIGIARHKLIDHYRRSESEKRRMALVRDSGGGCADQQLDDFDGAAPDRVADLLRDLSESHRLVLALRWLATKSGRSSRPRATTAASATSSLKFAIAMTEAKSRTSLGDRPLVVVTAGKEAQGGWMAAQDELAALSTNSAHRILPDATHAMLTENEATAAQSSKAILDVVRSVRTGTHVAR